MNHEKVLLGLYFLTLIIVVLELSGIWPIAISIMLILIITLVQKINMENKFDEERINRDTKLNRLINATDGVVRKVDDIRYNLEKNTYVMENKINKLSEHSGKDSTEYRDIVRKLVEVENKSNQLRKTLAAVFSNLDDRVQKIEKNDSI